MIGMRVVLKFTAYKTIKMIFLLKLKKSRIKNLMKELINLLQVQNLENQKLKDINNFFKKRMRMMQLKKYYKMKNHELSK